MEMIACGQCIVTLSQVITVIGFCIYPVIYIVKTVLKAKK